MLDMEVGCDRISYMVDSVNIVRDLNVSSKADVLLDRKQRQLSILRGDFNVGKISLQSSGSLSVDTLQKALATDLVFKLEAQSLSNIIERLSKKYIAEGERFTADGAVVLEEASKVSTTPK